MWDMYKVLCENVDWDFVAQYREYRQAVVNVGMSCMSHIYVEFFFFCID
jgi:hypothetical protein